MGNYNIGEVWWTQFPFEDSDEDKHKPAIVIDDNTTSVGTANMDNRSFRLNFEVNAFIYDGVVAKQQAKIFLNDQKFSTFVTKESYEKRSRALRIKESLIRLVAPIL